MPTASSSTVIIYSDGSCLTQSKAGAWAAVILHKNEKKILTGQAADTTNNQMELTAAIKAIEHVIKTYINQQPGNESAAIKIVVVSDSQYVVGLEKRLEKLAANNFLTNAGTPVTNIELVRQFYLLLQYVEVSFEKIKAHQRMVGAPNYNREVDMLARKLARNKSGVNSPES